MKSITEAPYKDGIRCVSIKIGEIIKKLKLQVMNYVAQCSLITLLEIHCSTIFYINRAKQKKVAETEILYKIDPCRIRNLP